MSRFPVPFSRHLRASLPGLILGLLLFGLAANSASAQESISLTLGTTTVRFPGADPGTTASIAAQENPISVAVDYTGTGSWVLSVLANGDLVSGTDTIPISKVQWTATGTAFNSGTLSKSSSQTVGSGSVSATGTLSFFFANSWSYPTGNYSQSISFTAASF